MVAEHSDRWTLRDAVVLHATGDQAVRGLVHVLCENIAWAQEIE